MSVPVTFLKGVKAARAAQLGNLGVHTLEDLISLYPIKYENRGNVCKISELEHDKNTTVCVVIQKSEFKKISRTVSITNLQVYDETGYMQISIFSGKYGTHKFEIGDAYAFYGRVTRDQYGLHMTNPVYTRYTDKWDEKFFQIQPIYPLSQGLTQNIMRKIMAEALLVEPIAYETLPNDILEKYSLINRVDAINNIHFPANVEMAAKSRKRLKFEELFTVSLMLYLIKDQNYKSLSGISFKGDLIEKNIEEFKKALPFKLTEEQENVWQEISMDMDSRKAMNRLVMGDVGSGKTVLAVMALLKAVMAGWQAVYMAPTEILAEQHYENICKLLENTSIKPALLTGSLSAKEKKDVLEKIETGEAKCIIGTHALIQPTVKYRNLGLAITDEQHRFGVRQRAVLSEKETRPDVLVMTATPIPRTLALILYGDMDISTIKTTLPGRKEIKTYAFDYSKYDSICQRIKEVCNEGKQVYMVYPLIDTNENMNLKSVVDSYEMMSKSVFSDISCGLLHGKMTPSQKDNIMREFKAGKIQILFSTTVVEVGVDVPNAVLMVIENAERFGLAQLHQLRGRVGRNDVQSYCILISEKITERMRIMEEASDGFLLSEKDLEIRGPGDFFGVEQHGLPRLKIADVYADAKILKYSSDAAKNVIENREKYASFISYICKKYPDRIQL